METQIVRRLFLALKMHIFDLKMHASGPGEETGKGLSSLIQIGSAFGREGGLGQLTSSGPFQPLL